MPSKKKKYNARFPAGRIKKIMQSDEEIGKVAQAVPVIISRTLELFVDSLLTKTLKITNSRNAKTLSTSHMKQCIMSESRFDFLRDLVRNIPDISMAEDIGNESSSPSTPSEQDQPYDLSKPSTSCSSSTGASGFNLPEFNISIPTNANGNILQNGIQIVCTSNDVSAVSSSSSSTASLFPPNELKRQWDTVNRIRKNIEKQCTTITPVNFSLVPPAHSNIYKTLQHPSNKSTNHSVSISAVTPPKLCRRDSTPAETTTTVVSNKNQSQAEQTYKNRRLQHQAKSVPCSSKDYNSTQQQPILTPAPIDFSSDFTNKPIVKIDYSNLALHDTDTHTATTIRQAVRETSTNSLSSPIINIDLSKIIMSPNLLPDNNDSNNSKSSGVGSNHCITVNSVQESFLSAPSSSILKINSSLDLDEDYDNI